MPPRVNARSAEMPTAADLEDGMEGKKSASPWRIFTLARPEWPWLGVGLAFLSVSLLPYLFLPIAIGRILDALSKDTSDEDKEAELTEIVLFLVSAHARVFELSALLTSP